MKRLIVFILLCHSLQGISQVYDLRQFAAVICPDSLRHQLDSIASAAMEGRETTTEGQRRAAAYIARQFASCGLSAGPNNNYQQVFPVYRDSLAKASLTINSVQLKQDTDFVVTANSAFNVAFAASEVLFVGYGVSDSTRDDYANVNARGKIVMVLPGAVTTLVKGKKVKGHIPDYFTLQDAAQKNGAIALLIVDQNFPRAPQPSHSEFHVVPPRENIPNTFLISDSVAARIMGSDYAVAKKMTKQGPPLPKSCYITVQLELNKLSERLESSNVIGVLEGTDKAEEALMITAHYDHLGKKDSTIYFGADDDGSGTVSVIMLARAFSQAAAAGARPRRTVVFMTVSGEEEGLWGSSYYAENPIFPLDKTTADLNIDMIGRIEKKRPERSQHYVYVIGDNRLSSDLRPISESANAAHDPLDLDYKFNDPNDPQRIYYRSDHYNFARKGVPVIFYFGGLHDDYHRPTDTPDKIEYDLLARRAQLVFYTAWEMANREHLLNRDLP